MVFRTTNQTWKLHEDNIITHIILLCCRVSYLQVLKLCTNTSFWSGDEGVTCLDSCQCRYVLVHTDDIIPVVEVLWLYLLLKTPKNKSHIQTESWKESMKNRTHKETQNTHTHTMYYNKWLNTIASYLNVLKWILSGISFWAFLAFAFHKMF